MAGDCCRDCCYVGRSCWSESALHDMHFKMQQVPRLWKPAFGHILYLARSLKGTQVRDAQGFFLVWYSRNSENNTSKYPDLAADVPKLLSSILHNVANTHKCATTSAFFWCGTAGTVRTTHPSTLTWQLMCPTCCLLFCTMSQTHTSAQQPVLLSGVVQPEQ